MASLSGKMIGFGMMGLTWRTEALSDEQMFATLKMAVERGALHWSTADFYGPPSDPMASIRLIKRYFEKYPEDAKSVRIWVKSCYDFTDFQPKSDRVNVWRFYNAVQDVLGTTKSIDYFGPSRRDSKTSIADTMAAFKELVDQGKIRGTFMSEVGADTIREAHAVFPLSAIEVEFSLFSPDLLHNGVSRVTKENNIPIFCYSPLGHGLLTGRFRSLSDVPDGDPRHDLDRFHGQHMAANGELSQKFAAFGRQLGATPAQVALAWIHAKSESAQAGVLVPIPGSSTAERVRENATLFTLTDEQVKQIEEVVPQAKVSGGRANKYADYLLWA